MSTRLLFLCSQRDGRSRMARACVEQRNETGLEVRSAWLEPCKLDPLAGAVMEEMGIVLDDDAQPTLAEIMQLEFDVVVTLCPEAAEACPLLPGRPIVIDWNLLGTGTLPADPRSRREAYTALRDSIQERVDDLFGHGYMAAFQMSRRTDRLILESVSDGIMAHDMNRRIVYFNRAAELLTGRSRKDVLNRDCHEVFDGRFCGGRCLFTEGPPPAFDERRQRMTIVTASGEDRLVDVRVKPLLDTDGERSGVVLSFRDLTREHQLARRVGEIQAFSGIIGQDEKMLEVFDLVRDVADTRVPVMIQGESGTGKELVAAAIHNESNRADRLFVPVNCGALPEGLLESELFGHVKGAFTGAIRDKKGRFELADGGTIFLDEVGDITLAMQVRLLRVLQEGSFERVGSEKTVEVSVRVISATHKDLSKEIEEGRFREDLFYRLNVVPLWLPPLRDRPTDISLLVDHLLRRFRRDMGRPEVGVSPEALDIMMNYDWPGNVRELQNWLQFALVKCRSEEIMPEHLPPPRPGQRRSYVRSSRRGRRGLTIESVRDALTRAEGNRVETAKLLGVSRATLYRFFSDHAEEL